MIISGQEIKDESVLKTAQLFLSTGWGNYGINPKYAVSTFGLLELTDSKSRQQSSFRKLVDLDDKKSDFALARKKYKSDHPKEKVILALLNKWLLPGNVLEVGCGSGFLSEPLIMSGAKSYVGTDIVLPEAVHSENPSISFIKQKSSVVVPVKDDSFTNAILVDMLHHVYPNSQLALLREISKKLKNSGRVIFFEYSFPHREVAKSDSFLDKDFFKLSENQRYRVMAIVDYVGNTLVGQSKTPTPFSFRTLEEWQEIFIKTGFSPIHREYLGILSNLFHPGPYSVIVAEKT